MARLCEDLIPAFDPQRKRGPAAPDKTKRRTSRQKRERQTKDDEYDSLKDVYKAENPACAYCGQPTEHADHIVSGSGRGASLINFDAINPACASCNCNQSITRAAKAGAKLVHVLKTIERLQGRNFRLEEERQILKFIRKRGPGHER